MRYIAESLQETEDLAIRLAKCLEGNEIVLLNGDLGAGKTTFTKSLIKALGVDEIVTSPTFAFMKEYLGRVKVSHYDMYRSESEDELWELGISDNLEEDGVCVIEWNKFSQFPKDKKIINIKIEKLGDCSREFNIEGIAL